MVFFSWALFCLLLNLSYALDAGLHISQSAGIKECKVIANGAKKDDVPNILSALRECDDGGTVIFPEDQNYWIATKLHPIVRNIKISWKGKWTFSDDLTYWRKNNYPIAFQNHRAAFILSGSNISINGFGIGGIHGNGDAWYNAEQAKTREGRPMPFVLWNVSSVSVRGFNIWQPALWALNIMNGTDLVFEDIYVNATATKAPWGKNWVQNTDGFDTMDVNNVSLRNLTYQGGDDCIAIKPRSYNVHVSNVSCRGGNGIAIGSLGQYLEDSSVVNVTVENVRIVRYNEDMHNSAYIKTWIGGQVTQKGYESAGVPRGGGWGSVKNITFQHFHIEGADSGPTITQDNGDNGKFSGTSKMNVEGVVFEDFEGWLSGKKVVSSVGCSKMKPCRAIEYRDMKLRTEKGGGFGGARCKNVPQGAVKGLNGGGCGS